jgi:hypothetical protein
VYKPGKEPHVRMTNHIIYGHAPCQELQPEVSPFQQSGMILSR